MALRWRVTIEDYRTGVYYVYDRDEPRGPAATRAALAEFEAQHPDAGKYGETYGVRRVVDARSD